MGDEGVRDEFSEELSETYWIYRTRHDLPDYLPDLEGVDTFTLMAERGVAIIDRVVTQEMGGDVEGDDWFIPDPGPHF
jgi:hypothetical protein